MMVLVDKFQIIFKEWLHLIQPECAETEMIEQKEEEEETGGAYNLQS